ncbi:hypothetical protein SCLCIDRAFT_1216682 [Scleroderma citrinum Foug A]|uniref:Uncharacterized protein n=1 Tax=Scleroderma citrinum Foug A TaxID=1036808 RepID=A0A0C3DXM8_9AGAM|nr:hypothetical protein SCLCIDRAFT_1216682 [Scleroderma citrinum Foug A]
MPGCAVSVCDLYYEESLVATLYIHVDGSWVRDRECLGGTVQQDTVLSAIRRDGTCPGGGACEEGVKLRGPRASSMHSA